MPLPVFSIITVTYNAAAVLERTLISVLTQSCKNIEYLIIDGASTDETVAIARRYQMQTQTDGPMQTSGPAQAADLAQAAGLTQIASQTNPGSIKRFEMLSESDRGLYDAMNKGLEKATGDYVWFLNAGDTFKSTETVGEVASICAQKGFPDILYGETDLTDEHGKVFAERRLKTPQTLTWKSFRMGMLVSHQAFIVKRSLAPEYDLQYRFSADFDWCIRCMKQAKTIENTRLRLIHYQYEGTTTANRKASLKERYEIMGRYYGSTPTRIRHLWFTIRFYWAKLFQSNY